MNVAGALRARPTTPAGRRLLLLALVAAAVFLVAGVTGNSFAVHAGTAATGHPTATAHGKGQGGPVPAAASPGSLADGSTARPSPLPLHHDGHHLMHLLGACLAILAGALLLRASADPARRLPSRQASRVPGGRAVPPTVLAWIPPPPSPPSSSPVLRT